MRSPRVLAELLAKRHWFRARASDLTGTNHAIVRLKHPKLRAIVVGCTCGKIFWVHRKVRHEQPVRAKFASEKAFRRAVQAWLGVHVHDVSARRALRARGLPKAQKARHPWF